MNAAVLGFSWGLLIVPHVDVATPSGVNGGIDGAINGGSVPADGSTVTNGNGGVGAEPSPGATAVGASGQPPRLVLPEDFEEPVMEPAFIYCAGQSQARLGPGFVDAVLVPAGVALLVDRERFGGDGDVGVGEDGDRGVHDDGAPANLDGLDGLAISSTLETPGISETLETSQAAGQRPGALTVPDMSSVEAALDDVRRVVDVPLSPNEISALVALRLDVGAEAFETAPVIGVLNGDLEVYVPPSAPALAPALALDDGEAEAGVPLIASAVSVVEPDGGAGAFAGEVPVSVGQEAAAGSSGDAVLAPLYSRARDALVAWPAPSLAAEPDWVSRRAMEGELFACQYMAEFVPGEQG